MVAVVDDIEATNYNQGLPNAQSLVDRIISRIAPAAFAAGKIQKIRPLISAEYYLPDHEYSGQYLGLNGMKATEVQWRTNYNNYSFTNKSNINITGYSYFDYANMLANNVVK